MKRIMLVVAVATCAATMSGGASASLKKPEPLTHECRGHLDYACTDGNGNFCTVWRGFNCYVGVPIV